MKYYQGDLLDHDNIKIDEMKEKMDKVKKAKVAESGKELKDEKLKPKKHLQPILQKLSERQPIQLNYLGTSFGVTKQLFQFWRKNNFIPIYLRQTANELTGEHSCVMVRPINLNDDSLIQNNITQQTDIANLIFLQEKSWLSSYFLDFKKRLLNLLGYDFRALSCSLAFQFIGEKN